MTDVQKPYTTVIDFITGKEVPDMGAEANRQAVEKLLVEEKGYLKSDIEVDVDMVFTIGGGEPYRSQVDLVVAVNNHASWPSNVWPGPGLPGKRDPRRCPAPRFLPDPAFSGNRRQSFHRSRHGDR